MSDKHPRYQSVEDVIGNTPLVRLVRLAGLDLAALFSAPYHRQRRPVFHRTGRVVAFELAEDDVAALLVLNPGKAHQTHHRRIADDVFDRGVAGKLVAHKKQNLGGTRTPSPQPSPGATRGLFVAVGGRGGRALLPLPRAGEGGGEGEGEGGGSTFAICFSTNAGRQ